MSHTPGPWRVEAKGPSGIEARSPHGTLIATVRGLKGLREANARLIAAAPDLLVALKKIAQQIDQSEACFLDHTELCRYDHDVVRAAIAKAEGK